MEANWADDVTRCAHFLCCDASPIGIYWQGIYIIILSFDKLVCRIIKERLGSVLVIWQPSPKSFLSCSLKQRTYICSLRICKALLSSFLAATLHIAFTETLILSFICIFVKLSLTRDL